MSHSETPLFSSDLSPEEVSRWAHREIVSSAKAFELRVKEASSLAAQYTSGKISTDETAGKMLAYDRRWGDALFGASIREAVNDDQILSEIDKAREDARQSFVERTNPQGLGFAEGKKR